MKAKRIISALIAAIMLAMMIPFGTVMASAAKDDVSSPAAEPETTAVYDADTVALVNGVEVTVDNILDVLLESPMGGTVEIVKDFTTFSLIFQNSEETGITSKWVINGNGHTISSPFLVRLNTNYLITTDADYVEINDLTLVTMGSGIVVKDGSQVHLNNVNVYTGGTKAGTDPANKDYFCVEQSSAQLNSIAVKISASTRSTVYINGGTYKAYGVSGQVLAVDRGNMVVYGGTFVGEDCSFVARVKNSNKVTDLTSATASLTVYDGTFIKPVIDKKAAYHANNDTTKTPTQNSDGAVIRGDAGGIINIYDGTFACFSGKATKDDGTTAFGVQRDFVILSGISTNTRNCVGFINIFGGNFYSFMTEDCNEYSTQLIGNVSGSYTEMNEAELTKINTSIYGGNFYSNMPSREDNIKSVVNKTTPTIQHVPSDQYATTTSMNNTVTLYGKQFTGVTKWTVSYLEPTTAPANATVKVKNSNGSNYYISDYTYTAPTLNVTVTIPAFAQAVNGVADKNSTVTLLKYITITPTEILNRGQKMTIDGNGKKLTSASNGLTVSSGEITVKNLTIKAGTLDGNYAFKIAKSAIVKDETSDYYNVTVDAFNLVLKLENCAFTANIPVIDNPFLEGSVTTTGCTANNGSVLNITHTYTAPKPPVIEWEFDTTTGTLTISGDTSLSKKLWIDKISIEDIKSIVIADGVTAIGNNIFALCTNLESVSIANSVKSIGNFAFQDCYKLKSFTLGNGIQSIGEAVFMNDRSIESITLPEGLESIDDSAFLGCTKLKSIILPASLTTLGKSVFRGCDSLSSINVATANTKYKSIDGILYTKDATKILMYPHGKTDKSFTVPTNVKTVGAYAFSECPGLTSVVLPDSVTTIEEYAFYACGDLESVDISKNVIDIDIYAFCDCQSLKSVNLPEGLNAINKGVFKGCVSIESIFVPESVRSISDSAFYECMSLKNVILSNTEIIGTYAFWKCVSLKKIVITANVVMIGKYAFSDCTALETLVVCSDNMYISNDTIRDSAINKIIICGFKEVNIEVMFDNPLLSKIESGDIDIEVHDHKWDKGEITTPATETSKGVKLYTCLDCGKTKFAEYAKGSEESTPGGNVSGGGQTDNNTDDDDQANVVKKGCSSAVVGSFGALATVACVAAVTLRKKKED